MKELILKKISELVVGDVFHTGFSSPCSFEVLEVVELESSFDLLLAPNNASFTGWQSYPKSEVMRMSQW